ncbi:hypothetical protein BOX15_Mlig005197g1, partial [Macrostomum lignano]
PLPTVSLVLLRAAFRGIRCHKLLLVAQRANSFTTKPCIWTAQPGQRALCTSKSSSSNVDEEDDSQLDYDEYVEYLGDDRRVDEAAIKADLAAAAAERRRRFVDECPVDAVQRGRTGVIDLGDLVRLLRHRNARDIVVMATSPVNKFRPSIRPPYLAVCSGRSSRHLVSIAEYVLQVYKSRVLSEGQCQDQAADQLPRIEVGSSPSQCNWAAMDLGNCELHCFLPAVRTRYDLESLWCLGPELDSSCQSNASEDSNLSTSNGIDWDKVAREALEEKQQRRMKAAQGDSDNNAAQNH